MKANGANGHTLSPKVPPWEELRKNGVRPPVLDSPAPDPAPEAVSYRKEWNLEDVRFNAADLLSLEEEEPVPWLPLLGKEGFFVEGWSHLVAGSPKVGKTELLARIIGEWAVLGQRVAYLTEESVLGTWRRRVMGAGVEAAAWERVDFFEVLGWPSETLLVEAVNRAPDVLVVDTARSLLEVRDENDNAELVRRVAPWVAAARETGLTLVLVAHHRKAAAVEPGERIAGGNALLGLVDAAIEVERGKGEDRKSPRRLVHAIGRYPEGAPDALMYGWDRDTGLFEVLGAPDQVKREEAEEDVLAFLFTREENPEGSTVKDLARSLDRGETSVRRCLEALLKRGKVERQQETRPKPDRWWKTGDGVIPPP